MADNSFEFFPPQHAGGQRRSCAPRWQELAQLKPRVLLRAPTAPAARRATARSTTVTEIRRAGHEAAPHISCVGSTRAGHRASSSSTTRRTASATWSRCAATCPRASAPRASSATPPSWWRFIREKTGDWFHIEVAVLPRVPPADALRRATSCATSSARSTPAPNSAITQYFYNADAYFHFVDDCRAAGISMPIVPGIMPIANFSQLARFSDASGAEIPRWMRLKLEGYRDDAAVDPRLRPGRGHRAVREAPRRRRARAALLHLTRPRSAPRSGAASSCEAARRRGARRRGARAVRLGLLKPLENRLLDSFVRHQAAALAPDPDIVLVNIDEKSLVDDGGRRDRRGPLPVAARGLRHADRGPRRAEAARHRLRHHVLGAGPVAAAERRRRSSKPPPATTTSTTRWCASTRRQRAARPPRSAHAASAWCARPSADPEAPIAVMPAARAAGRSCWRIGTINFLPDDDGVGRRYHLRAAHRRLGPALAAGARRDGPRLPGAGRRRHRARLARRGRRASRASPSATCTRTSSARSASGRRTSSAARSWSSAPTPPACGDLRVTPLVEPAARAPRSSARRSRT